MPDDCERIHTAFCAAVTSTHRHVQSSPGLRSLDRPQANIHAVACDSVSVTFTPARHPLTNTAQPLAMNISASACNVLAATQCTSTFFYAATLQGTRTMDACIEKYAAAKPRWTIHFRA